MILTTKGYLPESSLERTLGFEDRPSQYAVWVEWKHDGELVRRDAFPLPKETADHVHTVRGEMPVTSLRRFVEVHDAPDNIAIGVVWMHDDQLVRRDAHLILKEPSVSADALSAAF